jgi:hypothetical protein
MANDIQSPPLEPALLAAFRQEGAVILAHERGLTTACRMKLAGVARRLGIGDDQMEAAIKTLTAVEPSAPPNFQAERFRRRLRKDLRGKPRAIIGPTIEAKILASARRKYGLDAALAGQVLAEVTSELGLMRISANDAIQTVAAQIDQAAGNSTWLARETWDRLRSAGSKWGLDVEVIDTLIEERLAANRAAYRQNTFWTDATIRVAVASVVVAALIFGLLIVTRRSATDVGGGSSSASVPATSENRPLSTPKWWDVDLSVEMAHAKSQLDGLNGACVLMASSDASQRAAGYQKLIEHIGEDVRNQETQLATMRIAAGCYALESDDTAATQLRSDLIRRLPAPGSPLPASTVQWNAAFWAADAAGLALNRRGITVARKTALADALAAALSDTVDTSLPARDLQKRLRQLTASAAYRHITSAAANQPAQVAALHPALSKRAAAILPDDEFMRCETAFLVAALPAAGGNWRVYERPLARCVASPDPLPALRLLDALRRGTDAKLIDHLSKQLLVRAGVRPKSSSRSDVIAAVRQSLGAGAALTAADRWISLRDEAMELLEKTSAKDDRELLNDTVTLAHLTTMAVALVQGQAGFALFDAGLSHPPQLAQDLTHGNLPLDEAQQLITDCYRQRAALLALSSSSPAASTSVTDAAKECVAGLAAGLKGDPFVAELQYHQEALRYLAGDSLRYTVALQRLLLELSARRIAMARPERAATARQLAAEALSASAKSNNVLAQLRDQEAALLKLWMLYGPES